MEASMASKSKTTKRKAPAKRHYHRIPVDAKVFPVSNENPRRKGTAGFKSFATILRNKGATVGELRDKGVRATDIRWDLAHENLKLKEARAN
jgi:hypothetical protein